MIENPSVNQWIDSEPELKKDQLADLGIVDDEDVIIDEVENKDADVGNDEVGDKRREDEELTASLVEEEKFDDFDNEEIPTKESCNLLKTIEDNSTPDVESEVVTEDEPDKISEKEVQVVEPVVEAKRDLANEAKEQIEEKTKVDSGAEKSEVIEVSEVEQIIEQLEIEPEVEPEIEQEIEFTPEESQGLPDVSSPRQPKEQGGTQFVTEEFKAADDVIESNVFKMEDDEPEDEPEDIKSGPEANNEMNSSDLNEIAQANIINESDDSLMTESADTNPTFPTTMTEDTSTNPKEHIPGTHLHLNLTYHIP